MTKIPASELRIGKQISISLKNEPGTLANLTDVLGSNGINIFALCVLEGLDHGYIRIVVDKPDDAIQLLRDSGHLVLVHDVLLMDLPNRPGSMLTFTRAMAEAGINVEYLYCASGPQVEMGLVVVRVKEPQRAYDLITTSE